MLRSLLLSVLLIPLTISCTHAKASGDAGEPVAAASVSAKADAKKDVAPTAKLEFPPRVAAGDRFPVVVYLEKTTTPVSLKFDDTTVAESLPWSNRQGGAYVYSVILQKKGDRTVKVVKEGQVVGSAPIHVD